MQFIKINSLSHVKSKSSSEIIFVHVIIPVELYHIAKLYSFSHHTYWTVSYS